MKNSRNTHRCLDCRFFSNDPDRVEEAIPGLTILSSAYASVRADAGVCSRHEIFLPPWNCCRDFLPRP